MFKGKCDGGVEGEDEKKERKEDRHGWRTIAKANCTRYIVTREQKKKKKKTKKKKV